MDQRSPEWFQAKLGLVSASRIGDVMAKGKGITRTAYMTQLITETLTGVTTEIFVTREMQWGVDQEAAARACAGARLGEIVQEVGFVRHPHLAAGASPDGLIGDDAILEIKCPATHTMVEWILTETIPTKYVQQIQWQMACTGRKIGWFCAYDPRLPSNLQCWLKRIDRDNVMIAEIEKEVQAFTFEMAEKLAKLKEMTL
jgi:putative phage-type endonuclease